MDNYLFTVLTEEGAPINDTMNQGKYKHFFNNIVSSIYRLLLYPK